MAKGILEFICGDSEEAQFVRRHTVVKIIPMLNPDGVVLGNFRTALCGRDLNRTFRMKNDFLIPEIRALKELVVKLKLEFKSRFMMFFDLHGHSVKKNVFLYGP
jgi:cytosolic carboxypeptidase protein 2/3